MRGLLEHSTNKLTNITADTFVIVRYFTFLGKNMSIRASNVFSKAIWP